jgi:hypothetical protein
MHKRCRRTIIDYRFHPGEGPRSQNNAFSKAIIWHNQLRPDLKISPCKIELLNFTYAIISTFRCQYFKSLSGSLASRQSQNSARTKCTTESSGAWMLCFFNFQNIGWTSVLNALLLRSNQSFLQPATNNIASLTWLSCWERTAEARTNIPSVFDPRLVWLCEWAETIGAGVEKSPGAYWLAPRMVV